MTFPAPMRLWVFSDVRQEHAENAWDPAAHIPICGFDVAVIAGDVHMPLTRALDWLGERLPGVPVIYVPGSHDFWWDRGEDRYTIYDQMDRGLERTAALGIHDSLQHPTLVHIGSRQLQRGGDAFRIGEDVPLRARVAPVERLFQTK